MLLKRLKNSKRLAEKLDATAAMIRQSKSQRQSDAGAAAPPAGKVDGCGGIGANGADRAGARPEPAMGEPSGGVAAPADRSAPGTQDAPCCDHAGANGSGGSSSRDADVKGAGVCAGIITAEDIRNLDDGELADLDRLVWIAQYVAARHADKKKLRDMMEPIVSVIKESADGMGAIEDDIHGMLLSAETSLGTLRDMQASVCADQAPHRIARADLGASLPPDAPGCVPAPQHHAAAPPAGDAQDGCVPPSAQSGSGADAFCNAARRLKDDIEIND